MKQIRFITFLEGGQETVHKGRNTQDEFRTERKLKHYQIRVKILLVTKMCDNNVDFYQQFFSFSLKSFFLLL